MFAHNDRAKFFDFIIPVVPIINSSNSLDKMQERIKEEAFKDLIDPQFLREVSLYIDDLRIIHNIFNEFIIYYELLKSDNLDSTKLLAMMIYKNTYPNDFEQLHHGKGALFEVCKMRLELLVKNKNRLRDEITILRNTIEAVDNEQLTSIQELIKVYIGHIVTYATQPVLGIVCNNQHIIFSQLTTIDSFEPLLSDKNIHLATNQQSHPHYRIATNKTFSQIDAEINPNETFLERKKNIEVKLDFKRDELNLEISFLERKIIEVSQKKLHQLLQQNEVSIDSLIENNTTSDGRLLVYLIRNGYLDENYHIFTSNFHEGRLTKNDRDFLLTIRSFNQPDPKQQIDTPEEVCKNMRLEDFGHKYVLNVDLMDHLLDSKEVNQERISSAIQYISQNFKETEDFFVAYYSTGKNKDSFVRVLAVTWPEFSTLSVKSAQAAEHVSYLLRFVEPQHITDNMNQGAVITKFISEQGHLVFASDIKSPEEFAVLKVLNVKFFKLKSVEKNKGLLDYAHKENLYSITPENVKFVIEVFSKNIGSGELLPETANYTTITSSGSDYFKKYVSENLSLYIENIFLFLPDNTLESGDVIRGLINNAKIDDDHRKKIIAKEQFIFDDFEDIPMDLWAYILFEEKVIVSWRNISEYLKHDENVKDIITELLGRQHIVDNLVQTQIDIVALGDGRSKAVSWFIISNDKLPDGIYSELIKKIPYKYKNFPNDISDAKLLCLVKENKISLNEDSFKFAEKSEVLFVNLIVCNVEEYFKNKEKYPLSDESLALLLSMQISKEYKILIIQDITPSYAKTSKELSRLIANVVKLPDIDCNIFDEEVVSAAIINAGNTQDSINILMKCIHFRNEEWTMNVLAQLPTPFNEIASYGKRPNLPKTKENLDFAKLLETKKIVSSITEKSNVIRINTFKSSDQSEVE